MLSSARLEAIRNPSKIVGPCSWSSNATLMPRRSVERSRSIDTTGEKIMALPLIVPRSPSPDSDSSLQSSRTASATSAGEFELTRKVDSRSLNPPRGSKNSSSDALHIRATACGHHCSFISAAEQHEQDASISCEEITERDTEWVVLSSSRTTPVITCPVLLHSATRFWEARPIPFSTTEKGASFFR